MLSSSSITSHRPPRPHTPHRLHPHRRSTRPPSSCPLCISARQPPSAPHPTGSCYHPVLYHPRLPSTPPYPHLLKRLCLSRPLRLQSMSTLPLLPRLYGRMPTSVRRANQPTHRRCVQPARLHPMPVSRTARRPRHQRSASAIAAPLLPATRTTIITLTSMSTSISTISITRTPPTSHLTYRRPLHLPSAPSRHQPTHSPSPTPHALSQLRQSRPSHTRATPYSVCHDRDVWRPSRQSLQRQQQSSTSRLYRCLPSMAGQPDLQRPACQHRPAPIASRHCTRARAGT